MSLAKRLSIFITERFPVLSHLTMILLFVFAHAVIVIEKNLLLSNLNIISLATIATFFFFFKLRLYDEIKDYELDCVVNPSRPLPRGLITHKEIYCGIALSIAIESLCILSITKVSIIPLVFTIIYSLLMFKEFFIRTIIRKYLTTYAVTHTVVVLFWGVTLTTSLTKIQYNELPTTIYYFLVSNWMLFNIFEFGRKTFLKQEERVDVESYSKIFGKLGAVTLVLAMAVLSFILMYLYFNGTFWAVYQFVVMLNLITFGLIYVVKDKKPFGEIYRNYSSIYIVLTLLGIIVCKLVL